MKKAVARRLGVLFVSGWAVATAGAAPPDGAALYHGYCSVCHGDAGDGRSRARGSMIPPPRDFTTPQAAVELTRERMLHSVREGRPRTAMVGWKTQLSDAEVAAVVDYIRTVLMRPIASEHAEAARRLYAENCSVCHGDDGRGARWTLTNMSPAPRNFTKPGTAEVLSREEMLRVVSYGKANTAMPGFATQLSEQQIAQIVDYIRAAFMRVSPVAGAQGALARSSDPGSTSGFPGGLDGDPTVGQAFYLQNCAICHGVEGDGKGPRAYFILPKPRDFRHPAFRHGFDRRRLYTAIAEGTLGSEMPAWNKVLSEQEIVNVAEYLYQTFVQNPSSATVP